MVEAKAISSGDGLFRPKRLGVSIWWFGAIVIALVIASPLGVVVGSLAQAPGEGWQLVSELLLADYIKGTLVMVAGVGALTLFFGVGAAWTVTVWEFPGRRFFSLALMLPMAIPTYVAAYAYAFAKFEIRDPLLLWVRERWGAEDMSDTGVVFKHELAILVMSLVLYPYVFIAARVGFAEISGAYIENSRLLGRGLWRSLFTVGLPLARPAIIGGMMLALLEVINEYGAMIHYGIETLTTGIFVSWTDLGDIDSAVRLAGVAMLVVFALILIERGLRGRKRFHAHRAAQRNLVEPTKTRGGALAASCACGALFFAAFILPVWKLLELAMLGLQKTGLAPLLKPVAGSVGVALAAGVAILAAALFLAYAVRVFPNVAMRLLSKVCMLGYALPGAVVAITVLVAVSSLSDFLAGRFGLPSLTHLLFTATPAGLAIAYAIRFMTPALAPVEAGMGRVSQSMDEASRLLGRSTWGTFFRIHVPLLRLPLLGALVVLFVDILKELPLTLVLRPPNVETLATRTYGLIQKEERIAEGAVPALILVLCGVAGVIILHRLIRRRTGA